MDIPKKRILIIDDDPIILNILRYILKHENYEVLEAESGGEGLQLAEKESPDLILLDINLPDILGFYVCRKLKKKQSTRDIPVIFLTVMGQEGNEQRGFEEGAADFLRKPIDRARLCIRVNNVLEMTAARKKLEQQALDLEETNTLLKDALVVQRKIGRNLLQRDQILSSVNYVAKSFLQAGNWADIIQDVLRYLGENVDSEHVYLKNFESRGPERQHYTWYKLGNTVTCSSIDLLATWRLPDILLQAGAITGPGDDLPPFLLEEFEKNNIRTYLILPVFVYKQFWGCIGFDCSLSERSWDTPLVQAMMTSSDILSSAIQRTLESRERIRLAAAINEFADSVLMTDTDGRIFYANPASKKVTGYLSEELIGKKIEDIQVDERGEFDCRQVLEAVAGGSEWHGELRNRQKNGTLYEEAVAIIPVKGNHEQVSSFCIIKHDQTEQKRLESIAEAANLMDNVGFVFSGIRHELGNPLNSLKMAISVLLRQLDGLSRGKIREFLDRSMGEIKRMEYLLYSLKNFNVLEEQQVKPTELVAFFEKFTQLHEKELRKKGIKLELLTELQVCCCLIDERALHQVLLNLLTNSVNALQGVSEPVISIHLIRKNRGFVQVRFQDNGCGFSEQIKTQLFKPFFTTRAKGTGLGLTIVQKMLTAMNCTVHVEGEEGKGACVVITLPLEKN